MNIIELLQEQKPILKKKYGVEKIGIFGSCVRGEEDQDSDVDVLVSFRKDEKSFKNFMDCKFYLEDLFERKVDLVMMDSVKPRYKPYIFHEIVYV
ncbi:MAG: nucleotidyltransferase family protein [Methanospirillaceae archaeon]|nr:nucleotidyltransferase family protein [Methanospirillaceae archaeon]